MQERLSQFRTEEATSAVTAQLQAELSAYEESLKTKEQKQADSFDKTEALLIEAYKRELITKEKFDNLILAADDKLREEERKREKQLADDVEKQRLAAVEKYKGIGLSRLEILEQDYKAELDALQNLEDQKIELTKTYDEIRLELQREHTAAKAEIEAEERESRLAKIEEENQLLVDSSQRAVDGVASAFKQLAIEGKSAEEVFKNLGKAAASSAVDIIASMVKVYVKDKILELLSVETSKKIAQKAAPVLTDAWIKPATLASIATFGGAAAAGAAGIGLAYGSVRSMFGSTGGGGGESGGSFSGGNLGTSGGGFAGQTSAPSQAQAPGNTEVLNQLQSNAYNADAAQRTPITVNVTSTDPNTDVAISYARGQYDLQESGFNTEDF